MTLRRTADPADFVVQHLRPEPCALLPVDRVRASYNAAHPDCPLKTRSITAMLRAAGLGDRIRSSSDGAKWLGFKLLGYRLISDRPLVAFLTEAMSREVGVVTPVIDIRAAFNAWRGGKSWHLRQVAAWLHLQGLAGQIAMTCVPGRGMRLSLIGWKLHGHTVLAALMPAEDPQFAAVPIRYRSQSRLLQECGLTPEQVAVLRSEGISTREHLADLDADELIELLAEDSPQEAGAIIMAARAHWFEDRDQPEETP